MSRKFLFSITANNGLVQAVSFDTLTASDLPTDVAYTDAANTFTAAPQTISCNADGNKGLVVKQHSGTQSADLLDLSDNSGAVLSQFDSGGNLGVRTTDFSEIVPTGGTCRLAISDGTAARFGFQSNFGGFLAMRDLTGNAKAYVASINATEGLVLGTYSNHPVTFRQNNTDLAQILTGGGFWSATYDVRSTVTPVEMITGVLSNGSTSVVNNVTCSRFDGAGGAASNGIGAGHCFRVNTSTTFGVICSQVSGGWTNATHATRRGFISLSAYDSTGGPFEAFRVEANSGAPRIAFFGGANAFPQQAVIGKLASATTVADLVATLQSLMAALASSYGLVTDSTT